MEKPTSLNGTVCAAPPSGRLGLRQPGCARFANPETLHEMSRKKNGFLN